MRPLSSSTPATIPTEQLAAIDEITKAWPNKWHRKALNSQQRVNNFLSIKPEHHEWLSKLTTIQFAFVLGPCHSNINAILDLYHSPITDKLRAEHSVSDALLHIDLYLTLDDYFPDEHPEIDDRIGKHKDELYTHRHYDSLHTVLEHVRRLKQIRHFAQRVTDNNVGSKGAFYFKAPAGLSALAPALAKKLAALGKKPSFDSMSSEAFSIQLTEIEQLVYQTAKHQLSTTPGLFAGYRVPGTGRDPGVDQLYRDIQAEYKHWYGDEATTPAAEEAKMASPSPQ
ncbi:MAG: hypothetical protein P1U40_05895 [Coxiellaceae bacterium]|nr:hypothetical protein [Coxiellaceae bacterium]